MPNISDHTITDVHEKMAEIQQLADEIADVMPKRGWNRAIARRWTAGVRASNSCVRTCVLPWA